MIHTYHFRVEMPCSGCAGQIQRLLKAKMEGGSVKDFQINLQEKRVSVTTTLPVEQVHAELKKSGKTVTLLSSTKQELFGQTEILNGKPIVPESGLQQQKQQQQHKQSFPQAKPGNSLVPFRK